MLCSSSLLVSSSSAVERYSSLMLCSSSFAARSSSVLASDCSRVLASRSCVRRSSSSSRSTSAPSRPLPRALPADACRRSAGVAVLDEHHERHAARSPSPVRGRTSSGDTLHRAVERTATNGDSVPSRSLERAEQRAAQLGPKLRAARAGSTSRMSGPPGGSRNRPAVSERWTTFRFVVDEHARRPELLEQTPVHRRRLAASGGRGCPGNVRRAGRRQQAARAGAARHPARHLPRLEDVVLSCRPRGRWAPSAVSARRGRDTGPDGGRNETRR